MSFDRYVVEGGLAGSYLYKDEAARIGYMREGEVNEVEWSQRLNECKPVSNGEN